MNQWTARDMQWVATDSAQWLPYSFVKKVFKLVFKSIAVSISMQTVFSSALSPIFGKYYSS